MEPDDNYDDLQEYETQDKRDLEEERLSDADQDYRDDIYERVADMRRWG